MVEVVLILKIYWVVNMINRRIYIEINNTCNFSCRFCPYPLLKIKKENMEFDLIKKLIADIKENIPYRIIYFHNLNEPFLYPKIDELIKFCDKNHIKYGITTNGTLLHRHIKVLKNCKMSELNISYQVNDELENSYRKNNMNVEDYRKYLVNNIIKFKNHFKGEIKIKLLITTESSVFNQKKIRGIETISEVISEIDHFNYLFLKKHLRKNQLNKLSKLDITKFCKINLFDNIFIELFPFLTWGNYYDHVHKAYFGNCDGLTGQLQIKANGDVLPCCYDFNSKLKIGNIKTEKLSNLLLSHDYAKIFNKISSKRVCYTRCQVCLGNKSLCQLLKDEYRFLFKSKIDDRFIFSDNNIKL